MTDTPVHLRAALDDVPAYAPGKPASAPAGVTAYKVSSNENPFPPLPSVVDVVRDAAGAINRYPDMAVTALTARYESVGIDCVMSGADFTAEVTQALSALLQGLVRPT